MKKTKVQQIIDFVEKEQKIGGCSWTDIQMFIINIYRR